MSGVAPKLLLLVDGWGCGNVFPRRDRRRARCGGPAFCQHCLLDLALAHVYEGGVRQDMDRLTRITGSTRPAWYKYLAPLDEPEFLFQLRDTYLLDALLRIRPGLATLIPDR